MWKLLPAALATLALLGPTLAPAQVANPTTIPGQAPGTANSPNRLNTAHAPSWPTGTPTETQVKEHLEADGYTDIEGLKQTGEGWSAQAVKSGRKQTVQVDRNGAIKVQ